MGISKAALLFLFLLSSVKADILDDYLRTDGVWILTRNKQFYKTNNEKECAEKCEAERQLTCRAFLFTRKKLECLTLAENAKMTVMFTSTDAVLYEKRIYLMQCKRGIGTDYRGTEAKTQRGIPCQKWAEKIPHKPNYTPEKHPNAGLEENYCRNPDGDESGPWCYTTDPATRFDYCAIPECEDQVTHTGEGPTGECMQCNGEDYHGEVSRTESGLECQRWDAQEPHMHAFTQKHYPEKDLKMNYCRNPDGELRPWCFTTSPNKRWEYCNIPRCSTRPPVSALDSQCLSGKGEDYRGRIAITESGNACQHWNTQFPHKHGWIPDRYPCKGLEENYCRNPDGEKKPWCYTTNSSVRWEYCTIPPCDGTEQGIADEPVQVPLPEECYRGKGQSYRGTTSVTASGKKCQAWNSMFPHRHIKTPDRFPDADLRDNYCRNPDGDSSPWCFTTDPNTIWEYCNLKRWNIPVASPGQLSWPWFHPASCAPPHWQRMGNCKVLELELKLEDLWSAKRRTDMSNMESPLGDWTVPSHQNLVLSELLVLFLGLRMQWLPTESGCRLTSLESSPCVRNNIPTDFIHIWTYTQSLGWRGYTETTNLQNDKSIFPGAAVLPLASSGRESVLSQIRSFEYSQKNAVLVPAAALGVGGMLLYWLRAGRKIKTIDMGDGWWGSGERPLKGKEDESIRPFKIETSDKEIEDLHRRLDNFRFTPHVEGAAFHYGFNSSYLRKVVAYWRNQFDWRKQVEVLNKYPHFHTTIEGIDIHFIHVKPSYVPHGQAVQPLLMVHGWPGSFYEFYKIIPLLTEPARHGLNEGDVVFEVICPSIPGYGFSEAPHQKGFDSVATARIFHKLMNRLGFKEYYLQGGDWGSRITTNMAQMLPQSVKGLHLNCVFISKQGLGRLICIMLGAYVPWLVGLSREDARRFYPFMQKNVYDVLRESGYLHIQGTKPDTAGCGLNDSPVGLAAYILEKFSTWTDKSFLHKDDGGLESKYSLEELLTNVMIYWVTSSIVSSMRYYKENFSKDPSLNAYSGYGIYVPTGIAAFPQEILHTPHVWAKDVYKNIITYSYMPRGGHFAAFEEPKLLAQDIMQFVRKVEQL